MLRRRSIRLRIVVLVLVPVLALIGLYAVVLDLTLGTYLTLKAGGNVQKEITQPVANLQVALSTERALALLYMAEPKHSMLAPLLYTERRTDRTARLFEAAASSPAVTGGGNAPELHAIRTWRADLATLTSLRTSVVSVGISRTDALGAYSNIITDGNNVTNQAILPLITGSVGIQAIDIVNLEKAAQTVAEESDLIRADLTARSVPVADLRLFGQLVALHQEIWNQTLPALDPKYQVYFKTMIPQAASSGLAALENDIIVNGVPRERQTTLHAWNSTVRAYGGGLQAALYESGVALEASAHAQEQGYALRLILTGGLGLLAIVAAVGFAVVVSRGMVRQLNELRLAALEVSGQRLPSAIERLRAGEELDLAIEAPSLEPSTNEIGQVRQAFNTVHQTAIAAAVDENRIRRGVNDVFRNLARRNQSLLTRQLQLLDAMERRIHDPEELADLFRIDHLTTRMRRHAEGLLIVAGGSSGRSWREPVPIVDVMRAAVAEIEDYTRIRVLSRTSASVAGHAVADVIHLLAEILENATMFSPTNTPVRVDGDLVARGLAMEIEDRGLGMSEDQIAEINRKLADPPLFDLSGSDQLGLFIAGQLARRHDIKITLRTSAFGGTAAVVLLPRSLVIVMADDDPLAMAGVRELGGRPIPQLLAALPRTEGGNGAQASADADADADAGQYGVQPMPVSPAHARVTDFGDSPLTADNGAWPPRDTDETILPAAASPSAWPAHDTDEPALPATASPSAWPAHNSDEPVLPATAGTPAWPTPGAGTSAWPASDSDADADLEPATSAFTSAQTLPWRSQAAMSPATASDGDRTQQSMPDFSAGQADPADLPVRVRQASLAPQLREQVAPARADREEPSAGPSPEAARSTMAALQQGWERGRSLSPSVAPRLQASANAAPADSPPDAHEQPEGGDQ